MGAFFYLRALGDCIICLYGSAGLGESEVWGCEIGADWVRGNGGWESKTWKENAAYKEEEWEWEANHACRAKREEKNWSWFQAEWWGGCFWSLSPSFG